VAEQEALSALGLRQAATVAPAAAATTSPAAALAQPDRATTAVLVMGLRAWAAAAAVRRWVLADQEPTVVPAARAAQIQFLAHRKFMDQAVAPVVMAAVLARVARVERTLVMGAIPAAQAMQQLQILAVVVPAPATAVAQRQPAEPAVRAL
jgi:sterol desaturase/sphingolipid hydroxylase (fatty acid hydroxylase superfamily)